MTPMLVEPDVSFVEDVIASGGGDVKKCFQCGTCSVVCNLSPERATFPRRQMLQAQWGLKERLLADPSIWLCHNCGDCSDRCPRGARPGDVFGALRSIAIRHYAFPKMLGEMTASPGALPFLLLVPVLILGLIAALAGQTAVAPFEFAMVFPQSALEALFFTVSGFALLAFAVGLIRFARAASPSGAAGAIAAGAFAAAAAIATHARFRSCERGSRRYWGHLLTFWGFVGLAAMGTAVGVGTLVGIMHTPLPMTSGWKIFANACAAAALAGIVLLLVERTADPVRRARSTYFDWLFLLTLAGVLLTGVLSEILRLGQVSGPMYGVYFVHLVLVLSLILYAPYSKFAHLAYRTVAMAIAGRSATARERLHVVPRQTAVAGEFSASATK
jgi:quinone-modifying oxidoreductase subunit QmoC